MGRRKVFLPEFSHLGIEFGIEIDYIMTCDKSLLNIFNIETLELLLKTQIDTENYETAAFIRDRINKLTIE